MQDRFNEHHPAGPKIPDASLLNSQARVLNAMAQGQGGPWSNTQSGKGFTVTGPPPFILGLAKITDAGNDCAADANAMNTGEVDAPCALAGKYLAKFRFYDHKQGGWSEVDHELRLDASGYDTRPSYAAGDVTAAWWDEQRGWLIPVHIPPTQMATEEWESNALTPVIDLEGGQGTPPSFDGVIAQIQWNHGTGWRGLYGRDLTIALPRHATGLYRVNSLFTAFPVQNGTKIRLVAGVGANEDFGADAISWGIRFWFVTRGVTQRHTDILSPTDDVFVAYGGMKTLGPLQRHGVSQSGMHDNPSFVQVSPGVLQCASEGFWTVYCDFRLEVRNKLADASTSSSSSSSSQSDLSSSSSPSLSSTSQSGQSSVSSASSASSAGDGTCVQVVTDVECVDGELVVTKCFICGPDLEEECESGSSQGSSPSTASSASSTSVSSVSSSSVSSASTSSGVSSQSSASSLSSAQIGACCFDGVDCIDTNESHCVSIGGVWHGPGTACEADGACPNESSASSLSSSSSSNSSSSQSGSSSSLSQSAPVGRCCYNLGASCDVTTQSECDGLGGTWDEGLDCNTSC